MTSQDQTKNERLRLVAGCALALFMTGAIGAAPGAVIPQWREEFGTGGGIAGYFNLFFVGMLLGTFFGSRLRLRHPWVPLALVAEGLGLMLVGLSPGFSGVLVAALALGAGVSVANFHANALPGELYREGSTVLLIRVNAAFGVGAVLAPLLMVLLPWRVGYVVLALLALAAAALLWKVPPPEPRPVEAPAGGGWGLLPFVLAAILAYTTVEIVVSSFSGLHLALLGYDARLAGVLLSLYWVGLTVGRLTLAPFVAARPLGRLALLHAATVLVALCYLAPPLAWLFPLVGFLLGPTFPTLYGFAQTRIGYGALAYVFYAGAAGSALIPAAFALVPAEWLGVWILGAVGVMAATTFALRRRGKVD